MAPKGSVIEYLDDGRFICAMVLDEAAKRLRVLNQNGREVNLPNSRIIHQSAQRLAPGSSREDILNHLQQTAKKRESLMTAVDPEAVWHLAVSETDSVFSPQFLAELCFDGQTTDDHIAAFLRSVFQDRLFFKYKNGQVICQPEETVAQLRQQLQEEEEKEKFIERGVRGITQIWQNGTAEEWPEQDKCLEIIKRFYLFGNDAPASDLARELLKRAKLSGPDHGFRLLVKAGIWRHDENIPLLRHQIATDFSAAVHAEADALTEPGSEILLAEGRADLRHLELLTIDGRDTRDFDDALHIESREANFVAGVHVTDVSRFIKPGTLLFEEALNRGTSIYLPEGQIPMLPPSLSEGILSLIKDKPRAALSFLITLSPEAEVLDFKLQPSVVQVKRQLHYGEADQGINNDPELALLHQLSAKLRERRLADGAIILPFPDVLISICDDGLLNVTLADSDTPSRILISEFMILANTIAAQFLADREIPGLFRSQPAPRRRLGSGYQRDLYQNILQRKQLSPMTLSVKANPHSSLGVPQYTTVTSPIRRLLDLLMQHQLLSTLQQHGTPQFTRNELKVFAATIADLQARVNATKQLRYRYWLLKYLQQSQSQWVNGLVIDKGPRRVHVLLQDFMLDTDLPASQASDVNAGDAIKVRLAKIDPLNNILRIER